MYLHTLGNLTLTAYNSELSNESFEEKKKILSESHLELNKYFNAKLYWREIDIKKRAEILADKCLQIWTYFGEDTTQIIDGVTGTRPLNLIIWGQHYPVKYWSDVLEQTAKTIADIAPEKLEILIKEYPRFINSNTSQLGKSARIAEISNGVYINKNYSAENIQRFCVQAIETIELSSEDWEVKFS